MEQPLKAISAYIPDSLDGVRLYGIGDVHLGNPFSDEKRLIKTIEQIKADPQARVIITGDLLEMVTKSSLGEIWAQTMTPFQQAEHAVELLEPIKDRIIAGVEGNHEDRAYKELGFLPIQMIMARLGLNVSEVYTPIGGVLFISIDSPKQGKTVFTVYFKHGSGGGKSMGVKANRLNEMKYEVIADVYIRAHDHGQMGFTSATWIPNTEKKTIVQHRHLHVNSNTFLGWGGYAIKYGYQSGFTCAPAIKLSTERDGNSIIKHAEVRIST
jgi:hypothetical protein